MYTLPRVFWITTYAVLFVAAAVFSFFTGTSWYSVPAWLLPVAFVVFFEPEPKAARVKVTDDK